MIYNSFRPEVRGELRKKTPNLKIIKRWLEGHTPGRPEDKGYEWVLGAVGRKGKLCNLLAAQAVRLLGELRDGHLEPTPGGDRKRLIYGLFSVCTNLGASSAKILWKPLREVQQTPASVLRLSGNYMGASLKHELYDALAMNQLDDRMTRIWERMLLGKSVPHLPPGVHFVGYQGILGLPRSEGALESVCWTLGHIARAWSWPHSPGARAQEFGDCVKDLTRHYPELKRSLPTIASEMRWPVWARKALVS